MSVTQVFSIIVSAMVFFTVIRTLMKNKLDESNSIFWLLIGTLIFVTAVFPNIVDRIAWWLHIDYTPTLLFLVSSVLLFLICFKSSMDISRLDARVTELAISHSIINEENHQLKLKLAAYEENHQLKLKLAAYEENHRLREKLAADETNILPSGGGNEPDGALGEGASGCEY